MNSVGKRMRTGGLNRHALKRASHAVKSPEKRKRMGWGKAGKLHKDRKD